MSRWTCFCGRFAAFALLSLAACRSRPAAGPDAQGAGSADGDEGSSEPALSIVEAAVVVGECPDSKRMNTRAARDAIRRLVDPCAMVPGGRAHFAATLEPNGRIRLASPTGDPAEGVVPTCVLENKLQHRVRLRSSCKFDVQLVERPGAATAPSSASP